MSNNICATIVLVVGILTVGYTIVELFKSDGCNCNCHKDNGDDDL